MSLDWHLTEYDRTRTFEYICDQILNPDDYPEHPIVWELLDGRHPEDLVNNIEALADQVQEAIDENCKPEV